MFEMPNPEARQIGPCCWWPFTTSAGHWAPSPSRAWEEGIPNRATQQQVSCKWWCHQFKLSLCVLSDSCLSLPVCLSVCLCLPLLSWLWPLTPAGWRVAGGGGEASRSGRPEDQVLENWVSIIPRCIHQDRWNLGVSQKPLISFTLFHCCTGYHNP